MTTLRPFRTLSPRAPLAAVALAAGLTACLAGCASSPTLTLDSASPDPANPGVVLVRIRAVNPGDEPLPLRVASYSATIDGRPAPAAERSAEITVPARGQQVFTLPVVTDPLTPAGASGAFTLSGAVQWIPPGTVPGFLFEQGWRRPAVGFTFSGTVANNP